MKLPSVDEVVKWMSQTPPMRPGDIAEIVNGYNEKKLKLKDEELREAQLLLNDIIELAWKRVRHQIPHAPLKKGV